MTSFVFVSQITTCQSPPHLTMLATIAVSAVVALVDGAIKLWFYAYRGRSKAQTGGAVPVLQFLCDQCRTILAVTLDPEWQAQIVAGQLRSVGQGPPTSY